MRSLERWTCPIRAGLSPPAPTRRSRPHGVGARAGAGVEDCVFVPARREAQAPDRTWLGCRDLIEAIGGVDAGTVAGLTSPFTTVDAEAMINAGPAVILVTTQGAEWVGGIDKELQLPGPGPDRRGRNRRVVQLTMPAPPGQPARRARCHRGVGGVSAVAAVGACLAIVSGVIWASVWGLAEPPSSAH